MLLEAKKKKKKSAMTRRFFPIFLSLLAGSQNYFAHGYTAGGLIWRSKIGNFIPISNITAYRDYRQVFLDKVRERETHNFQAQALTLAYFEDRNLIHFYDNDTKISGVCGEIWNMLADYLNFTIVTIHVNVSHFGTLRNGSWDGLVGMLHRNEIQVIPRTGFYVSESTVMDYTTPIWENRYRLYIRAEWTSDGTWMFRIFSRKVWGSILLLLIFLSILGYWTQRISMIVSGDKNYRHNLHDFFLYTFATLCCQGFIPDSLYRRTKILGLTRTLFAWLLLIVLSSHLISYMTNRELQLPFNNLDKMFNDTTYNIVVVNGSMVYSKFKRLTKEYEEKSRYRSRFYPVSTTKRMYEKGCWGRKKYAIFEAEDRQRAFGRFICRLVPTESIYFATWIASGVSKGYKYKRTLDLGILKLNEFGLTDGMRDRWMQTSLKPPEAQPFDSINFNQVAMLFAILCMGMVTSLIVFICENIVFMYQCNRRKRVKKKLFIRKA